MHKITIMIQRRFFFCIVPFLLLMHLNTRSLDSAELVHPLYMPDINQKFFEYGTAWGNRALACTCKVLSSAHDTYCNQQAKRASDILQGTGQFVQFADNKGDELFHEIIYKCFDQAKTFTCLNTSSLLVCPGGKECLIVRGWTESDESLPGRSGYFTLDLDVICSNTFIDVSKDAKKKGFTNLCISDPQKKYCITISYFDCDIDEVERPFLCIQHAKIVGGKTPLFKIAHMYRVKLKGTTYTVYDRTWDYANNYGEDTKYTNVQRCSIDVNFESNNTLYCAYRTAECLLAGHVINYYALECEALQNEYRDDRAEVSDPVYSLIPDRPLRISTVYVSTKYRLKKGSLLHDMRAQNALYSYYTLHKTGHHKDSISYWSDSDSLDTMVDACVVALLWSKFDRLPNLLLKRLCYETIKQNATSIKTLMNRTQSFFSRESLYTKVCNTAPGVNLYPIEAIIREKFLAMKNKQIASYDRYREVVKNEITDLCTQNGWI